MKFAGARERAWIYISVPLLVTALLSSFERRLTPLGLLSTYFMNLVITAGIDFSIGFLYRVLGPRVAPERRPAPLRWIFHAVVIGAGVAAGTELALRAGGLILPELAATFPRLAVIRIAIPVSIAAVAVGFAREKLITRARELELREERAKRELLAAQLEALQARTNPHFLFNSLNTVAALIEEDPARAERALERLSALFRYALDGSRTPRVALSVELAAVEDYLAFERLRYGERLTAELAVDPAVRTAQVPPLVLQPLVENAVHHGVASKRGPGRVDIRARAEEGVLILEVEDDGPGPGGSRQSGSGTAQADLEARLKLNYGERADLVRGTGRSGSGYLAAVRLPLESLE